MAAAFFSPHNEGDDRWALPIVPHPQQVSLKGDTARFEISADTKLVLLPKASTDDSLLGRLINEALQKQGMSPLPVVYSIEPAHRHNSIIIAAIDESKPLVDSLFALSGLTITPQFPGTEGYVLDVNSDMALVAGNDSAGVFFGVQSLLQLFARDQKTGRISLPGVHIVDFPDMPLRSAFYGFYLNAMEDDAAIARAYRDLEKITRFKFNMIDLASHHYGHLEMPAPDHPTEKLWQRFARLYEVARKLHLKPRVGGWANWVNTSSPWGTDLSTLEGIRTSQTLTLIDTLAYPLRISTGVIAPNVIYDFDEEKSWSEEPIVVSNESGDEVYQEGIDYRIDYGAIQSADYRKYALVFQTHLYVLFSKLHFGSGEPAGYPLRWAETFNSPTTIRRLPTGKIRSGQTVRITFSYVGPDPYSLIKVRYCRSDARLRINGPENYIWRWCTQPVQFLGAEDFALDVDETRVFAFDARCEKSGKSRSRIWADDVLYYCRTIRAAQPNARIFAWSDMLDPAHNAKLYKTEGVAGIFVKEGLNDLIMIPWKDDYAKASVDFFADRGFPLMPSCQAAPDAPVNAPMWAKRLRDRYAGAHPPYGLMHCSWSYYFDSDVEWKKLAITAEHAWSAAPYIIHHPPQNVRAGEDVKLSARFEGDEYVFDGNEVVHGPLPLETAFLHYRKKDSPFFVKAAMARVDHAWQATIPASAVTVAGLEYYITMSDKFHTSYFPKSAPQVPCNLDVFEEEIK
jgi:hypothetical protein